MWVFRPILADPPLYNMRDLREWVTLDDVMDAHEALNVRAELARRTASKPEAKSPWQS